MSKTSTTKTEVDLNLDVGVDIPFADETITTVNDVRIRPNTDWFSVELGDDETYDFTENTFGYLPDIETALERFEIAETIMPDTYFDIRSFDPYPEELTIDTDLPLLATPDALTALARVAAGEHGSVSDVTLYVSDGAMMLADGPAGAFLTTPHTRSEVDMEDVLSRYDATCEVPKWNVTLEGEERDRVAEQLADMFDLLADTIGMVVTGYAERSDDAHVFQTQDHGLIRVPRYAYGMAYRDTVVLSDDDFPVQFEELDTDDWVLSRDPETNTVAWDDFEWDYDFDKVGEWATEHNRYDSAAKAEARPGSTTKTYHAGVVMTHRSDMVELDDRDDLGRNETIDYGTVGSTVQVKPLTIEIHGYPEDESVTVNVRPPRSTSWTEVASFDYPERTAETEWWRVKDMDEIRGR